MSKGKGSARGPAQEGSPEFSPESSPDSSQNLHTVDLPGKRVHLLGTAHLSARSTEEVAEVIERVRPDAVCVELCESRHRALTRPDAWREMNLLQVIRNKQATALLAHLILASFQRRLGERLGVKPGAEMVQAIESAGGVGGGAGIGRPRYPDHPLADVARPALAGQGEAAGPVDVHPRRHPQPG